MENLDTLWEFHIAMDNYLLIIVNDNYQAFKLCFSKSKTVEFNDEGNWRRGKLEMMFQSKLTTFWLLNIAMENPP